VGPPPPPLSHPGGPLVPDVPPIAPEPPQELLDRLVCDSCGAPHTVHSLSHDAAPVELGHTGERGAVGSSSEQASETAAADRPETPLLVDDGMPAAPVDGEEVQEGELPSSAPAPRLPPRFNVNTSILTYTLAVVPDPDGEDVDGEGGPAASTGRDEGKVTALSLARAEVAHAQAFLAQHGWSEDRLSAVLSGTATVSEEAGGGLEMSPDTIVVTGSRRIPTVAIVYDDAMLLHEEVVSATLRAQ